MATALKQQNKLLMPKATAVWLIENTALTFSQIAEFTALTEIELFRWKGSQKDRAFANTL